MKRKGRINTKFRTLVTSGGVARKELTGGCNAMDCCISPVFAEVRDKCLDASFGR